MALALQRATESLIVETSSLLVQVRLPRDRKQPTFFAEDPATQHLTLMRARPKGRADKAAALRWLEREVDPAWKAKSGCGRTTYKYTRHAGEFARLHFKYLVGDEVVEVAPGQPSPHAAPPNAGGGGDNAAAVIVIIDDDVSGDEGSGYGFGDEASSSNDDDAGSGEHAHRGDHEGGVKDDPEAAEALVAVEQDKAQLGPDEEDVAHAAAEDMKDQAPLHERVDEDAAE
jgi:hypothetical protein